MAERPGVDIHVWHGHGAVTLRAGELAATFLPQAGMLGVSLRHRGEEYLDVRGGVAELGAGRPVGLSLVHPWANRLPAWHYDVDGVHVDLAGLDLPADAGGLPIHGTLLAPVSWEPAALATTMAGATFRARYRYGHGSPRQFAAFPFPHEVSVEVTVDGSLTVLTTIRATGDRPVPVSYGWHPWFRFPRTRRDALSVVLPSRQHVLLDDRMLPTGVTEVVAAEVVALRDGRALDDHYVLGAPRLALESASRRLVLTTDDGYPYAQVYAPAGERSVCLEPMTAPIGALGREACPLVEPGGRYDATFSVAVERR